MLKRYTYRAYLTGDQKVAAAQAFGCARVVFNDYIAASKAMHEAGTKRSSLTLIKQVTSDAKKRQNERSWPQRLASFSSNPPVMW